MKILGIIPARGGSKGIPNKNIKNLNGFPLIYYSIKQGSSSKYLNKCIVSTDSKKIASIAEKYDGEVPFLRPEIIATDKAPSIAYLKHAIDFYSEKNISFDAILILQPTSPFRPDGIIDKAILAFQKSNADTLVSIRKVPLHYNPEWQFQLQENKELLSVQGTANIPQNRQSLHQTYHRDGAIYIIKSKTILDEHRIFGKSVIGFEIESPELINIDSYEDWVIAEKYCR